MPRGETSTRRSPCPSATLGCRDLTDDAEAEPSDAVKDEPVDKPDERGKQDVVVDDMYNFHQYYDPFGSRKYY
jgi:hypothetical protein